MCWGDAAPTPTCILTRKRLSPWSFGGASLSLGWYVWLARSWKPIAPLLNLLRSAMWPPSMPGSVERVVIVHQWPPLSERQAALCWGQSARWQAGWAFGSARVSGERKYTWGCRARPRCRRSSSDQLRFQLLWFRQNRNSWHRLVNGLMQHRWLFCFYNRRSYNESGTGAREAPLGIRTSSTSTF